MITKKDLQKYVFNNPTQSEYTFGLLTLMMIYALMLTTSTFLENELLLVGFIGGGILIGVSLSLTKNIFFPIGIILIYNLSLTFLNNPLDNISIELLFTTIVRGIGDALFISFVVYWVVFTSQFVLKFIKKLESPADEPITNKKFLLGSIIAGTLYGILMMIQNV